MQSPFYQGAVLSVCLCVVGGCAMFRDDTAVVQNHSPMRPAHSSPDSVKMEIIWARIPVSELAPTDEAWAEIDETRIDPDVRRELASNGLRAGVISGRLPEAIASALNHGEGDADSAVIDGESTDLAADAEVHGRVRQLRRNERMEIQASEVFASLPLLVSSGRELGGRRYEQAQAVYALKVDPQPDSTTVVELTPELHHGTPRMQWTGGDGGVLHQAPLRDREVFERLRISAPLAPGDILVLMSLPKSKSRLGQYFHTADASSGPQQKLILIRVADVPASNAFAGR
jgi:hypothetical protein